MQMNINKNNRGSTPKLPTKKRKKLLKNHRKSKRSKEEAVCAAEPCSACERRSTGRGVYGRGHGRGYSQEGH